jgi:adenylate cyclase
LGPILKLGKQTEVKAKGVEHPITLYEVLGVGGRHKLQLTEATETLIPLADEIPLRYEVLEANQAGGTMSKGGLTKVSCKGAEARLETPVPNLSNLKIRLIGSGGKEMPGTLYGKVLGAVPGSSTGFSIRFTSMSPEIETLLRGLTASVAVKDDAANTPAP